MVGSKHARRPAGERVVLAPGRERAAPAARMSAGERHALALRQSLRLAQRCADVGDYDRALAWLSMIEFIERGLPDRWHTTREQWIAAREAQLRTDEEQLEPDGRRAGLSGRWPG